MNTEVLALRCIGRYLTSPFILCVAAVALLFGASCAMELGQKPPVKIRLESPLSPEAIPLSDEERETVRKHPVTGDSVQAWCNREFSVEYEGETIVFPAERAYVTVQEGLLVSVDLYSPNLTGDELHHLMTTALRLWKASPEKVKKFEDWWRGKRESIVEMKVGEGNRSITLGVCPSFNREKPHVFKCIAFWGFPRDRTESEPAAKE
ncbi:MAG: hypothetical protein EXS06_12495 [Planctomycetaceae bacterium]|nr:hypothetical protein [Planctomycetaceae bacterium]